MQHILNVLIFLMNLGDDEGLITLNLSALLTWFITSVNIVLIGL